MGYGKDPSYGCTNPAAINYNPDATVDDGSCITTQSDETTSTGKTTSTDKTTTTTTTKIIDSKTGKTTSTTTTKTTDSKTGKTTTKTKTTDPKTGIFTSEVYGCTDPTATNYDSTATDDDGSCSYDEDFGEETTLVVEVGMIATLQDGWYFADPQTDYPLPDLNNPYVGPYHLMQDGTYMKGVGTEGVSHTINPKDVIFQDYSSTYGLPDDEVDLDLELDPIEGELTSTITPENIQEVREIVSDLFYKLWFSENTLTDEQVLSLQTTIRDGKKQTAGKDGRAEGEPLVFYKKDRNTLENSDDLQNFDAICRNIIREEVSIHDIPGKFELLIDEEWPRLRKKDKLIRSGTATAVEDEPIIDSNDESGNVY